MGVYQDKERKTWFFKTSWYQDGKRRYKTKRGFKTKRQAKQAEQEFKIKIHQGVDVLRNPLFSDYFDKWIEIYKKDHVSASTLLNYQLDSKRIKQGLGNIKIKSLNRTIYQQFINEFGKIHAETSVRKLNNAIRSCTKSAIDDGLITRNFTDNIEINYNKDRSYKVTYLDDEQIKQLLNYLVNNRNPHFPASYMILMSIYTGLRESELSGLFWDDIDSKNNEIHIRRAWKYKEKRYGSTKNKSSERTITCSPQMVKMIQELKVNDPKRVFWSSARNGFPNSKSLNRVLRQALKDLNIKADGFHFHSLRHSQAAILIDSDISIYDIAKRLGHSSTKMVEQVYGYEFEKHKKEVGQKINKAFENLENNSSGSNGGQN